MFHDVHIQHTKKNTMSNTFKSDRHVRWGKQKHKPHVFLLEDATIIWIITQKRFILLASRMSSIQDVIVNTHIYQQILLA